MTRIRQYDHGTVWSLSVALTEMLALFPSNRTLDNLDDDDRTGRRIMVIDKHPTIADIKRWRQILITYGIDVGTETKNSRLKRGVKS